MPQPGESLFRKLYILFIVVSAISLFIGQYGARQNEVMFAQEPFEHTPQLTALELTQTVEAQPITSPNAPLQVRVRGRWLHVGDMGFPIGDSFLSAEGIPKGVIIETKDSRYGYAEILGLGDHVLMWITDENSTKQYMVIGISDPLFSGNEGMDNGFEDYLALMIEADKALTWSSITQTGGLGAMVITQFLLCGPSSGATCISALLTGFGTVCYGGGRALYVYRFEYRPNMEN